MSDSDILNWYFALGSMHISCPSKKGEKKKEMWDQRMRVKHDFPPKIFKSYLLYSSTNNKLPVESHANAQYGEPHRALSVWDSHLLYMGCGEDGLNLGWATELLCSLGQVMQEL